MGRLSRTIVSLYSPLPSETWVALPSILPARSYAKNVAFDGNIHAEDMILTGDLEVENDAMFRKDVSISGDLYVDGVEHINDSETTQSSGDYMILRHNNPIPLVIIQFF